MSLLRRPVRRAGRLISVSWCEKRRWDEDSRFPYLLPCPSSLGVGILLFHAMLFSLASFFRSCARAVLSKSSTHACRDLSSICQGVSQEPKGEYLCPDVACCLYFLSNSSHCFAPNLGCLWNSSHASSFLSWSRCPRVFSSGLALSQASCPRIWVASTLCPCQLL